MREGLVDACARLRMPAVAVTDQGNLFALVKFYTAALARGLKPLVGVDALVREEGERAEPTRLVLLCQDDRGYRNLTRLVTRSYLEGQCGTARRCTVPGWIRAPRPGSSLSRAAARATSAARCQAAGRATRVRRWRPGSRFRRGTIWSWSARAGLERRSASRLARARGGQGVPVVATNDVASSPPTTSRRTRPASASTTAARSTIRAAHAALQRGAVPEIAEEMAELFCRHPRGDREHRRDRPALQPGDAARQGPRCRPIRCRPGRRSRSILREESRRASWRGSRASPSRVGEADRDAARRYDERLATELGVICQMGFAGYFLIVADFIRWARENGVPVGPGRGSGGGLAGGLRARHHRPGSACATTCCSSASSIPSGCPCRTSTWTSAWKAATASSSTSPNATAASASRRSSPTAPWRPRPWCATSARVLGHAYGFVDSIAKLIPFELGMTLDKALEQEEELRRRYKSEDECSELIELARKLEGLARNAGKHAGGVVIAPSVLTDFTPLYCEQGGTAIVTQFDKDDVEAAGPGEVRLPRPAHTHHHRLGGADHQRRRGPRRRGAARHRRASRWTTRRAFDAAQALRRPPRCSSSNRAA